MENIENQINLILEKINAEKGKISIDSPKLKAFIKTSVNGDDLITDLVFAAKLGKDREGLLVYVLTSAKIIKIEIDEKGFNSSSNYLKQVIGINKGVHKKDDASVSEIEIEFIQGSFGLRYVEGDGKIDSFFSQVDLQLRKVKGC